MLDCCSSYIVIRCYAAEDALVIAGCSRKVSLLRKTYNLISEWKRCEFAGETLSHQSHFKCFCNKTVAQSKVLFMD